MPRKRKTPPLPYNRIKEVLVDHGKSQAWLSGELDLDFRTVNRYVNNHRQPSIRLLFKIAKLLKISPRELLNG